MSSAVVCRLLFAAFLLSARAFAESLSSNLLGFGVDLLVNDFSPLPEREWLPSAFRKHGLKQTMCASTYWLPWARVCKRKVGLREPYAELTRTLRHQTLTKQSLACYDMLLPADLRLVCYRAANTNCCLMGRKPTFRRGPYNGPFLTRCVR